MLTVTLLVALLGAVCGSDVKYSQLEAGGFVADMDITLSFTDEFNPEPVAFDPEGERCDPSAECTTPIFGYDDDSVLFIKAKVPKKGLTTLAKVNPDSSEAQLGEATEVLFKLCFDNESKKDRKWRKAKDKIDDDKRCKKKLGTVEIAKDGNLNLEYKFPSDTPKATWFITAYVKCKKIGSDGTDFCAFDTTGGLTTLVAEPKENPATSPEAFIRTTVVESRTSGLYAAVVVMSLASLSLLGGFFVWEQVTSKNK